MKQVTIQLSVSDGKGGVAKRAQVAYVNAETDPIAVHKGAKGCYDFTHVKSGFSMSRPVAHALNGRPPKSRGDALRFVGQWLSADRSAFDELDKDPEPQARRDLLQRLLDAAVVAAAGNC